MYLKQRKAESGRVVRMSRACRRGGIAEWVPLSIGWSMVAETVAGAGDPAPKMSAVRVAETERAEPVQHGAGIRTVREWL